MSKVENTDYIRGFNGIGMPHGHVKMFEQTLQAMSQFLQEPGDHVEIGSAWGGSAIFSAMVKEMAGVPGLIYCVDPLTELGFYGGEDDIEDIRPTPELFWDNVTTYGLEKRIILIDAYSQPWPLAGQRFVSGMIDGDHTYEGCMADWLTLKDCVDRHVMFHDVGDSAWPACSHVFEQAIRAWDLSFFGYNLGVVSR